MEEKSLVPVDAVGEMCNDGDLEDVTRGVVQVLEARGRVEPGCSPRSILDPLPAVDIPLEGYILASALLRRPYPAIENTLRGRGGLLYIY